MRRTTNGTVEPLSALLALLMVVLLALGPLPALAQAEVAEEMTAKEMSEELVACHEDRGSASADAGEGVLVDAGGALAGNDAPAEDDASVENEKAAEEVPAAAEEVPAAAEGQMAEEGGGTPCDEAQHEAYEGTTLEAQSEEADVPVLGAQSAGVLNPRMAAKPSMQSNQVVTWDCVWLGTYPQTEVLETDALRSASWSGGDATVRGVRYRRIERSDAMSDEFWPDDAGTYRYFRYEPIKWRVLKVSGNTALVVADAALDCRPYNKEFSDCTWETSTIRSWLNGTGGSYYYDGAQSGAASLDFAGVAFAAEGTRGAILNSTVRNANNTNKGTAGGNDTEDKVFLLSEADVHGDLATAHGFVSDYVTADEARRCGATDYARAMGASVAIGGAYEGNCRWWLRSPGNYAYYAGDVDSAGNVWCGGNYVSNGNDGVRPALNIDLLSPLVSYAGRVSTDPATTISRATIAPIKGRGYDGKPYEPKPEVKLGWKTLVEGTDYTLSYINNVYVGTATIIVIGSGYYTGTATASFEVWKNGQPMTAWAVARQVPAASLKTRDVTVETPIHVAHAVSAAKPMEFRKTGGDTRLNVDLATGRVTVRRGTPAGTYPVKIRAIASGGANYADGSRTVECQVKVVSGGKLDQDFQVSATDVIRSATSLASADYLTRPFKVAMAAGNVTYKRVSGSGCLSVDSAGRLKIARGTKAGTYYAKVYATAAGDTGYKPCTRTVTVKVVVR